MAEPKPLASLSSGLLARKGSAHPAMRRPLLTGLGTGVQAGVQDDLGWNDMGGQADVTGTRPLPVPSAMAPSPSASEPAIVTERKALAQKIAAIAFEQARAPVAVSLSVARKSAFTLRLDAERHLKLRLACAVQNRSAQQIVTAALDQFLDGSPDRDRLADGLPRDRGER